MIFRRVVVERTSIEGTADEKPAALEWLARNGFSVENASRADEHGPLFQIFATRLVQDGSVEKWTATPEQIRRKP